MNMAKFKPPIDNNRRLQLGSELEDFIFAQDFSASIKDENGRYRVCNPFISQRSGIPLNDYIGLSVHDLGRIMNYKPSIITHAVDIDNRLYQGITLREKYKQAMPVCGGFIAVETIIKSPIFNRANQIIGIVGYGYNITADIDLSQLFELYQQYYPTKQAIKYLLRYLKIHHMFLTLPTKREMEVLLAMRKIENSKYIAKGLQLSPKTIDENKARLRSHLQKITLSELLIRLRIRNEVAAFPK
jgi:hypothetical protein